MSNIVPELPTITPAVVVANRGAELHPGEVARGGSIAPFVMTVRGSARHDRGEELNRLLSFVGVDVLQKISAQAVLDEKAGHSRPRLIQIRPVPVRIGLEHNLVQTVEQVSSMQRHVIGHDLEHRQFDRARYGTSRPLLLQGISGTSREDYVNARVYVRRHTERPFRHATDLGNVSSPTKSPRTGELLAAVSCCAHRYPVEYGVALFRVALLSQQLKQAGHMAPVAAIFVTVFSGNSSSVR